VDGEGNLPAWYSSMQMFTAGLLLAAFARPRIARRDPPSWVLALLPLTLFAMSADEVAQIHERIGNHSDALLPGGWRGNTIFAETGIWMFLLGIPFIIFFIWLLMRTRRYFAAAPGSMAMLAAGMALFLTGALGVEALSNAFTKGTRAYAWMVLLEE